MSSKTAAPLKGVFEQAKAQAAEAVMQPANPQTTIPKRKAGERSVRVSGYLPIELDAALRDEVISRTVAEHRSVSFNDVLVSILADWAARKAAQ